MRIRAARHRDLPAMVGLLESVGLPAGDIDAHLPTFLVGEAQRRVVALGGLEPLGRCALLRSIAVETGGRGRGWGRRLTQQVLRMAQDLGIGEVYLLTLGAGAWFGGLGFEQLPREAAPPAIMRTRQFAALCPASALLMRRALAPACAPATDDTPSGGPMKITVIPNGPLLIDVAEWSYTGEAGPTKNNGRVAFCRCGASANKPFCDGAHKRNNFQAGGGVCELTPPAARAPPGT